MREKSFADLKRALEDALVFERGERVDLKVTQSQAQRPPKAMSHKKHRSHSPKARLLTDRVCDDAEHQP